jgi:hypothetical protein
MKPRPIVFIFSFFIGVSAFLSSCDDIIEPSISKQVVTLVAPANGTQGNNYTINFLWNTVNHALTYHLQVVTPNFAAPSNVVLDTIVPNYKFSYTLSPGTYQWRVSAENGSTSTAYSTPNTFTVGTGTITQQTVTLTSPASGLKTNQSSCTFQWSSLFGATAYQFEIDTNNFANPNAVVSTQTVTGTQLSFTFPKSQTYEWRVMAQNDTAQSQWSVINQVVFNNTPPAAVSLLSPASATTDPLPVTLQWSTVVNAVKYELYVYQSDGVTIYNSSFPMALTTTSYSFTLGTSGNKIYWTVTATDAFGNVSQAPAAIYFTLQ